MLSVGFFECVVISLVALFWFKPEDWGTLLYKAGKFIRVLKQTQRKISSTYKPIVENLELEALKKDAQQKAHTQEPLRDIKPHD